MAETFPIVALNLANGRIMTGAPNSYVLSVLDNENPGYTIATWLNDQHGFQNFGSDFGDYFGFLPSEYMFYDRALAWSVTITLTNGNYIVISHAADTSDDQTAIYRVDHRFYDAEGNYLYYLNTPFYVSGDVFQLTELFLVMCLKDDNLWYGMGAIGYYKRNPASYQNITMQTGSITNFTYLNQDSFFTQTYTTEEEAEEEDPYEYDGESERDGGGGTFDDSSDPIDFPDLPTVTAVDSGFVSLYSPDLTTLKSLASYMWTNNAFDVSSFKKIMNNPMDCILGLYLLPISLNTAGAAVVGIGNISTGISMAIIQDQFYEVDCGYLKVNEYWESYLDYAPYTSIQIYLPYIGFRQLNTDDVMGYRLQVVYHVDILTGTCVCYIKAGDRILYTYNGNCSTQIPVTATDWRATYQALMNTVSAGAGLVASAAGPIGAMSAVGSMNHMMASAAEVMTSKPTIQKSGSVSSTAGILGYQKPYLIITRPNTCIPNNQKAFTGYPSYMASALSDLSGFTRVADINLSGVAATDAEKSEIIAILKKGVLL